MLRVREEIGQDGARETTCPFCFAGVIFFTMAPVYCHKCLQELPPIMEFEEILEYRIDYHFYGAEEYAPAQESSTPS